MAVYEAGESLRFIFFLGGGDARGKLGRSAAVGSSAGPLCNLAGWRFLARLNPSGWTSTLMTIVHTAGLYDSELGS